MQTGANGQGRTDDRQFEVVARDAGEMVGGDVANAISGSLDGVHLDIGERLQNIWNVNQLRPIVPAGFGAW